MAEIGPALAARLDGAQDHDVFEVSIFLRGEPEDAVLLTSASSTGAARANVARIREQAASSQAGLLDFLTGEAGRALFLDDDTSVPQVRAVEPLWINNSIKAELSRDALDRVLAREDVLYVELVQHASREALFDEADFLPRRRGVRRLIAGVAAEAATPSPTWNVTKVNAPLLWQKGILGEGVVVAVIDSGVNYRHPDLANRMWSDPDFPHHGYDFENDNDDPIDEDGHGTCCAGIVAGEGTAGRATGVAPRARILAIKVGSAETHYWRGMQFAIERGAHVISMSMTWKYPDSPDYPGWRRTCVTILAAGLLHANSIGNQGDDLTQYPIPFNIATPGNCPPPWLHPLQQPRAGLSSVISCGATNSSDALTGNSGRGPAGWSAQPFADYPYQSGAGGLIKPDICAPGPGTESCYYHHSAGSSAPPYTSFGGTSSATPHVAGCLSLLAGACLAGNRPIVPAQIQEAIENSARRIVGQSVAKENHYGAGRIDVFAAYNYGHAKGWW